MTAYVDPCEHCTACASCGRRWCPNEEPSPGEGDGICDRCYLTEDPEETA